MHRERNAVSGIVDAGRQVKYIAAIGAASGDVASLPISLCDRVDGTTRYDGER